MELELYEYDEHIIVTGLQEMAKLAQEYVAAEAEVARLQSELKAAQQRAVQLGEVIIPERMDELGLATITTSDGATLSVLENIRASLPKEAKGAALAWLRDNGYAALIKRKVTVEFGKGEDEKAKEALERLNGFDVSDDQTVHPQTLQAWVRECLAEGIEIPQETFGVYRQRLTKVKF